MHWWNIISPHTSLLIKKFCFCLLDEKKNCQTPLNEILPMADATAIVERNIFNTFKLCSHSWRFETWKNACFSIKWDFNLTFNTLIYFQKKSYLNNTVGVCEDKRLSLPFNMYRVLWSCTAYHKTAGRKLACFWFFKCNNMYRVLTMQKSCYDLFAKKRVLTLFLIYCD